MHSLNQVSRDGLLGNCYRENGECPYPGAGPAEAVRGGVEAGPSARSPGQEVGVEPSGGEAGLGRATGRRIQMTGHRSHRNSLCQGCSHLRRAYQVIMLVVSLWYVQL